MESKKIWLNKAKKPTECEWESQRDALNKNQVETC